MADASGLQHPWPLLGFRPIGDLANYSVVFRESTLVRTGARPNCTWLLAHTIVSVELIRTRSLPPPGSFVQKHAAGGIEADVTPWYLPSLLRRILLRRQCVYGRPHVFPDQVQTQNA